MERLYEPRHEKIGFLHMRKQRLCFRYTDSTIPLLPKSEISRLSPSSVTVQPSLCETWLITPKTGFLRTRLILSRQQKQTKVCRCATELYLSCTCVVVAKSRFSDDAAHNLLLWTKAEIYTNHIYADPLQITLVFKFLMSPQHEKTFLQGF